MSEEVESFPVLSRAEFDKAMGYVVEAAGTASQQGRFVKEHETWQLAGEGGHHHLKVTRRLTVVDDEVGRQNVESVNGDPVMEILDQEEDESEIIRHQVSANFPRVEYEVHLHVSYQVPVLYFFLRDLPSGRCSIEDAYRLLVPKNWQPSMSEVGILGAISQTEHPITAEPCFFIHPCNTATALEELSRDRSVHVESYMKLWLGIVGPPVGLYYPA